MNDRLLDDQFLWDHHAACDPLWAVLSFPNKRGRWDLQEFMKTGEREIALVFHRFAELQLAQPTGRILDFGCGVGRLSQAFARRGAHVVGVDISPSMVHLARLLNRYTDRVDYMCTAERGLEPLEAKSFGCIYSNIVLQHVHPDVSIQYLHEFFRLLAPCGLLVFQVPSHLDSPATAEIKAMPDEAYKGAIELVAAPTSIATSAEFAINVRVRNTSDHTWRQPEVGPLAMGNHWLDATGELMLLQDDGRAPLLQAVPSGFEWPVLMNARGPDRPGSYICEVDLVHEGVSWFAHKGSPTLRLPIKVTPGHQNEREQFATPMMQEFPIPSYPEGLVPAPQPQQDDLVTTAAFPMHGVPREQVMDIIRMHGGRLAYIEEDRRAGPEWVSYRYFVVGGN